MASLKTIILEVAKTLLVHLKEMAGHEHFLAGLIFIIGVLTLLIEVLF